MKKLISLLSVFLVLLFLHGYGQQITPMAELDYIIEEFTLPGGRLGNNVNCIVQGPDGFLWFGTHGGLHRYDGHEFVTYKNVPSDTIGETTTLNFSYVEWLYWDQMNMLWVTTWGGGLFRFDPSTETFKHFKNDPGDSTSISHQRVLTAIEDATGQLWFGTEHGLNRFDRATEKFTRYYADPSDSGSLSNDDIRSLYVDKAGTLWLGTGFVLWGSSSGALSRYNPDTDSFTNYQFDENSSVRGILEDSRGNFWIGGVKGLYLMNRNTGTFKWMDNLANQPFAPGTGSRRLPAVYSLLEDRKGGLWVGAIGQPEFPTHLLRYDTVSKKNQVLPIQSEAWQLCESNDGTLWVAGSGGSGKILKLKPKAKTYFLTSTFSFQEAFNKSELSKRLPGRTVWGPANMVIDSSTGHYWFQLVIADPIFSTSYSSVLADYDPVTNKIVFHHLPEVKVERPDQFGQQGISGLLLDTQGTLWGSYFSGIFNYDPKTKKLKQFQHNSEDEGSLADDNVVTLRLDKRGDIWAALFQGGVERLNPTTEKITHYQISDPDSDIGIPISLMVDRDGMIWVGGQFAKNGVAYVAIIDPNTNLVKKMNLSDQPTMRIVPFMAQSPITGEVVMAIMGQYQGIAHYMPTGGGILTKGFTYVDRESGFPFESIAGIVCDEQGVFWIASADSKTYMRYQWQNEFVFEETGATPALWRSGLVGPNGHIYFLNFSNGWVDIDPSKINPEVSSSPYKTKLVDLYMVGEKQTLNSKVLPKPLWLLDKVTLPFSTETFGFSFSNFDFNNADTQFRYRLVPYEATWKKSGNQARAYYYRVPPGEYIFEVITNSQMGANENEITKLKVIILPPWWRTWWAYGGYGFLFISGVFVIDRVQRRRLLAKANAEAKEKELEQAREIEKAYTDLKATQSQLIQSEKMASLGELTAGIAHEIQNPLNFVNNFSEVNKELLMEMNDEITKGNFSDVKEIAKNVIDNEEKIIFHGKRADGIVKGMLQHSRSSSGVKEPNDINALADEYLRLAYHGLRAKDKSFNAIMKTDFDESIGKINIIPQDIGRVILNLITNAFYVVNERLRQACLPDRQAQPDSGYEPTVTVSTKKEGNNILISVKDNGNGIPNSIKEKIFQPFFTTKPTGQGTGLGLSLSYDIVKAHGGELKVETNEGVGSEFIIVLPV